MKEATPSTPQQIIIISHPNHLPTPSSPPPHKPSKGRDAMDPTIPQPTPSINVKNHNERKREIMKQEKEMRQIKKQEAQNTKQEVEVKQCRARPSFSPNLILFEYAPRSAVLQMQPCFVREREIGSDHVCMYARAREKFDGLHRRPQNETPDMNPDPISSKRPD
jgi:hypothetical protein